jgi:L-lysine exporter family protein LysE/ArgO
LLLLLINGVLLGLGAAAPIGPVNVEIARRTLRFGQIAGFLLGCGAVTIDVAYAIVTSFTFLPVQHYPRAMNALSVAAAIFLAYLAYRCLRSGLSGHGTDGGGNANGGDGGMNTPMTPAPLGSPASPSSPPPPQPPRRSGHYATGLLLTALNPMTLGFWFVAVPGAVAGLTTRPRIDLPIVCAGVFTGAFAWVCAFTALIGRLHKFGGERWLAWIDIGGGLMLLAFALRAIWRVAASTL